MFPRLWDQARNDLANSQEANRASRPRGSPAPDWMPDRVYKARRIEPPADDPIRRQYIEPPNEYGRVKAYTRRDKGHRDEYASVLNGTFEAVLKWTALHMMRRTPLPIGLHGTEVAMPWEDRFWTNR